MPRDNRDRATGGEFTTEVTPEEVLGAFEEVEGPIVTNDDVAEALDYSRETARQKLLSLHEQGRVGRRKPGQQAFWWRTDASADNRPAVVGVTHDFYTDGAAATFDNGVEITVKKNGEMIETTISHPTIEEDESNVQTMERSPTSVLVEWLSDFYNEDEERDVKIPALDAIMQEVSDDE